MSDGTGGPSTGASPSPSPGQGTARPAGPLNEPVDHTGELAGLLLVFSAVAGFVVLSVRRSARRASDAWARSGKLGHAEHEADYT